MGTMTLIFEHFLVSSYTSQFSILFFCWIFHTDRKNWSFTYCRRCLDCLYESNKVILQLFFFQLFLLLLPFWTTVYKCIIDDLLFILIFSFCCFKRRFFYYSGLFFPLEYSFVCVFSSFFLVICMYIRFLKRTSVWLSYRLNTLITWSENFYYSNDWKQQTIVFAFIDVYLLFASTFSRFGTIQLSIWYHLTVSIKQRAVKDSTVKNYQVTIMLYRHL